MRRRWYLKKQGRNWIVAGLEPTATAALSSSAPMIPEPQPMLEEKRNQLLAFMRGSMAAAVAKIVLEEEGSGRSANESDPHSNPDEPQ